MYLRNYILDLQIQLIILDLVWHVVRRSRSLKARAVKIDNNTLLHMSISIIPRHLFGSLRSPFLGTGTQWLLCHPSWSVVPSKKSETCLSCHPLLWGLLEGYHWVQLLFLSLVCWLHFFTSLKVIGVSMAVRHGFCSMRSSTESSTGVLLFSTLWKCILKMDMFSLALDASLPLSSFIAMLMLVLWWAVSPPVRRHMFSHARRGFILMLWILVHIPLYQRAFANSTRSRLRLVIFFSCCWSWSISVAVRWFLSWSLWRSRFFSSMAGARIVSLAVYHPSHLVSIYMAVSWPARTTALQKLL